MCLGGNQTSTSATDFSSETGPWSPQVPYILGGFQKAKELYEQGPPDYYPGETLAGFDPAQTFAQEAIIDYVRGPRAAGMQAGAEGALMRGLAGETGIPTSVRNRLISGQVGEYNPFSSSQYSDLLAGNVRTGEGTPYQTMASALTGDVLGKLQADVLPGIRQQQVMYQPGGSSRAALQQNKAVADAVKAGLTTPLAQMYSDAYQTAQGMRLPASSLYADAYQQAQGRILPAAQQSLDQQIKAMGMYPSIMGAPLSMYGAIADVGAQRRAMTQEAMNRDMARYAYESGAPMNALQNYMSMITGNYGSTSSGGSSTTSVIPNNSGMQLLGTLGSALIMSQSDIHIKENIVPEGTKWKGLNVYTYNYIGDNRPRRGVMAQQVEDMYPHAVTTIDGIKHVNYGAI